MAGILFIGRRDFQQILNKPPCLFKLPQNRDKRFRLTLPFRLCGFQLLGRRLDTFAERIEVLHVRLLGDTL